MLDNKIKEFNVDQYLKKVDDSRLKKYKRDCFIRS